MQLSSNLIREFRSIVTTVSISNDVQYHFGCSHLAGKIPEIDAYGEELGRKILNDETDRAQQTQATEAPHPS
jgi:hypothetical protein